MHSITPSFDQWVKDEKESFIDYIDEHIPWQTKKQVMYITNTDVDTYHQEPRKVIDSAEHQFLGNLSQNIAVELHRNGNITREFVEQSDGFGGQVFLEAEYAVISRRQYDLIMQDLKNFVRYL